MQTAISNAIAALEALKQEVRPSSCVTIGRQVESYQRAKEIALKARSIMGDLMVSLADEAADIADAEVSKVSRDYLRCPEDLLDALFRADEWADDNSVEVPLSPAAEWGTYNARAL